MSEVTLFVNKEKYIINKELLIEHSGLLEDLLETYPDEKEISLTIPIKSIDKFVDYMNSNDINLDYDEFILHRYLDTKKYLDHLIYLMVKEGPDHEKILNLGSDLSWEIYNHLPLNMVPEEMLKGLFIEKYRTKYLPKYPENVRIIRSEREVKTEILISGIYYIDGLYLCWYENGQLCEKSNWVKGKMNGLRESWHPNGQLMQQSFWSEGERDGLYKIWYQDGKIEEESNWLKGKKHGSYRYWYMNGQMMEQCNFFEGKEHGLCECWYVDGKKQEESNLLEGKEHGLCRHWYDNGDERIVCNYSKGQKDGLYQSWYEYGQKEEESNWLDGKKHGPYKTWNQNGQIKEESYWLRGSSQQYYLPNSVIKRGWFGQKDEEEQSLA